MTIAHPGFADPVAESQAAFRSVLDAMARPGRVHKVAAPADPPPPLSRAASAVLLTLVDAETPLWLDAAAGPARDWVLFHCGAPLVAADAASFALALGRAALDTLPAGSDEAPELGATLILQVEALGEGTALPGLPSHALTGSSQGDRRLGLSGPGLAAPATLRVRGLPSGFVAEWAANRARFPRGVDVILCAGDHLAALPRSVRIEET